MEDIESVRITRDRPCTHPWDHWLDGNPHSITRGQDFTSQVTSLRTQIYNTARARGGKAKTSLPAGRTGGTIEIQFIPNPSHAPTP